MAVYPPYKKIEVESEIRHLEGLRKVETQDSVYEDLTDQIRGLQMFLQHNSFTVL